MNTLQLDADILRNLGIIAKDETMLSKVAKYVRRLAKQMTEDPTLMTKDEFLAKIERAERQPGKSFANVEELDKYIRNL